MAVILRSDVAISNPLPDTPIFGDLTRGLLYEFDADNLVAGTADGANLTTWAATPRSTPATFDGPVGSSNMPSLVHAAVNGHAAVNFDAANTEAIDTPTLNTQVDDPFTMVFVMKMIGAASSQRVLGGGTTAYFSPLFNTNGTITLNAGTTSASAGGGWINNEWQVFQAVYHPTASKILTNDGTVHTVGATASAPMPWLRIGSSSTGAGNLFNGQISETRIYDRALTDDEMLALAQYLMKKYGI